MNIYVCKHCKEECNGTAGVCVIVSTGSDVSISESTCPYDVGKEQTCQAEWRECTPEEVPHAMGQINAEYQAERHLGKIGIGSF